MRRRRPANIQDLRDAIDCLPRDTKVAMLKGIAENPIIVGAYSAGDGICPMLAAHRAGGRTSFAAFARTWDRFASRDDRRQRGARRATERELLVLRAHLEASLLAEEAPRTELSTAIREHRALVGREGKATTRRRAERPGEPYRGRELRRRAGWRWMRVVRTLEDYERTLAALGGSSPTSSSHRPDAASAPDPGGIPAAR